MGRGLGMYAAFRPPVLSGDGFDRFSLKSDNAAPAWATDMASKVDLRMRDRQHPSLRTGIDAFIETRKATKAYTEIFNSATLKANPKLGKALVGAWYETLSVMLGKDAKATAALESWISPSVSWSRRVQRIVGSSPSPKNGSNASSR